MRFLAVDAGMYPDQELYLHGTFIVGILCAKRSSDAPAFCPSCILLVRPIFAEAI
jgi:hypothetical protein